VLSLGVPKDWAESVMGGAQFRLKPQRSSASRDLQGSLAGAPGAPSQPQLLACGWPRSAARTVAAAVTFRADAQPGGIEGIAELAPTRGQPKPSSAGAANWTRAPTAAAISADATAWLIRARRCLMRPANAARAMRPGAVDPPCRRSKSAT